MRTDPNKNSSTLVLDVGKTNVKLLVMSKTGHVVDVVRLDNQSLDGPPYPHLDTERIWRWLLETARGFAKKYTIDAIVPTTHGCAAALIHGDDLVLPILDYEYSRGIQLGHAHVRGDSITEPARRFESWSATVLAAAGFSARIFACAVRAHVSSILGVAIVRRYGKRSHVN